jgi:L,D-peptidoglycan transpeptidase YkuD (ErfK/YbiS/YcfS/YnhG family)
MSNPEVTAEGSEATVHFGDQSYPAVVGKNGVTENKREGDWATPVGSFKVREVLYRPDQLDTPETEHATKAIERDDVWVDNPDHPKYNQPAKMNELESVTSHEKLWRDDHLYNVVVDLDYNRENPEPGKGSAIFMHVARNQENPAESPTDGCIAMRQEDLLELLKSLPKDAVIEIRPPKK